LTEVKSNEQYQALLHEIEQSKAYKAQVEEKVLEALLRDDEVKEKIRALAQRIDGEKKKLAEERKALDAQVAALEKAAADKRGEREALHGKAAGDMAADLESYEAIRRSGKKVAVARVLEDEICEGCRHSVPPQTLQEVRRGTQLVRCVCGRFLYEDPG
jgi:predicted  nucleic acid-binding Zn-ribbon protein